jgi:hypothetical protein
MFDVSGVTLRYFPPIRRDAELPVGGLLARIQGALSRLLTDGLQADAFLVLSGAESVAVLIRRADDYVLVARRPTLGVLDGRVYPSSGAALAATTALLAALGSGDIRLSLQPVWYN